MIASYEEEKEKGNGIAALLMGPVLGLLYVICLPFISIATITVLVGKKVVTESIALLRGLVSFGWRPSEAYLFGKKRKKKENKSVVTKDQKGG